MTLTYKPKCPLCGCDKYTKGGNTAGGRWVFKCSNGHRWHWGTTTEPFPYRDDDYYHPKNYEWKRDEMYRLVYGRKEA